MSSSLAFVPLSYSDVLSVIIKYVYSDFAVMWFVVHVGLKSYRYLHHWLQCLRDIPGQRVGRPNMVGHCSSIIPGIRGFHVFGIHHMSATK